jgi:hypothetical protein
MYKLFENKDLRSNMGKEGKRHVEVICKEFELVLMIIHDVFTTFE